MIPKDNTLQHMLTRLLLICCVKFRGLLMQDEFKDLRSVIYGDDSEMIRFRQLVINSVMATDLGDKQLKELRNSKFTTER